ncbi:MFS transporter [Brevibacterium aurantiacum]|uniref:Putative proline/betaine transporter n=1 Tax=Brevibacterium aurantiacum TaxID=273384 RepID=A0A2H1JXZ4_BREAU|nr:MFS transporter [Brevibacterium aurantiacum]SMX92320.1 metabolite-proton symporter [Brevibacterium aurantiacum]
MTNPELNTPANSATAASGNGNGAASNPSKVAFASFIGTTVEWYDYFLFGTAAVLVLNEQFFPDLDPVAGQLASLSTFAVAFVARPLGGLIFGHFGDRLSRKSMLVLSLLMMGIATFAIGLLPGYATIGVAAPVLLVLLRVVQGFGVGGEWGGAVLMAVEHAPAHKKAFYGSWPQAGVPAGSVLSSLVFFLVQLMPNDQFMSWGWRIPFLISAVLVVIGLFIRLRLTESPELAEVKKDKNEAALPAVEMLKYSKKSLLIGIFCLVGSNTLFYIASVYLLSYAPESTELTRGEVLLAIAIGASFDVIAIPLVAIFADRHGKRTMMLVGSIITALATIPIFLAINTGTFIGAIIAMIIAFPIAHSTVYATSSGFISGLFKPNVRYTGASISYQVGGLISSAPAPLISVLLYTTFQSWVPVALYLIAANLLAALFVLLAKRDRPTHV